MIETKELRLGNLIIWNPALVNSNITLPPMHVEVFSIMQDKIAYVFPNIENRVEPFEDDVVQMGGQYKSLEELEPIMLTPEVLQKVGFEKHSKNKYVGQRGATLLLSENEFLYEQNGITKPVQYLHQLQNLYFNLNGEELEFI